MLFLHTGKKKKYVIRRMVESPLQPISSPVKTSSSRYHISEIPLIGIHSLGLYSLFSFEVQTPLKRVTGCHDAFSMKVFVSPFHPLSRGPPKSTERLSRKEEGSLEEARE